MLLLLRPFFSPTFTSFVSSFLILSINIFLLFLLHSSYSFSLILLFFFLFPLIQSPHNSSLVNPPPPPPAIFFTFFFFFFKSPTPSLRLRLFLLFFTLLQPPPPHFSLPFIFTLFPLSSLFLHLSPSIVFLLSSSNFLSFLVSIFPHFLFLQIFHSNLFFSSLPSSLSLQYPLSLLLSLLLFISSISPLTSPLTSPLYLFNIPSHFSSLSLQYPLSLLLFISSISPLTSPLSISLSFLSLVCYYFMRNREFKSSIAQEPETFGCVFSCCGQVHQGADKNRSPYHFRRNLVLIRSFGAKSERSTSTMFSVSF